MIDVEGTPQSLSGVFAELCAHRASCTFASTGAVGNKAQGGPPSSGVYSSSVAPVVSQVSSPFPHSAAANAPPYTPDASADYSQYNQAYTQVNTDGSSVCESVQQRSLTRQVRDVEEMRIILDIWTDKMRVDLAGSSASLHLSLLLSFVYPSTEKKSWRLPTGCFSAPLILYSFFSPSCRAVFIFSTCTSCPASDTSDVCSSLNGNYNKLL